MSYLVLARKWRPQNFADLIGQGHVSRTLENAIASGRIHHAFLFTGARGVGKTSAARILAKALNCVNGPTAQPCNECPSCQEITAGRGLDVFEIDGASNTGVDDVRELRENIRYLPSKSTYKIFIIDEVHMLSINAFNALLKTLEEPPEHAKFIFATTEPHKIPITILSRCQRFDFRKIALSQIAARLRDIVDAEKVDISDRGLALIARRGEGSMRDALSTLDQVIAFCGEKITEEEIQNLLGIIDRRLLLETLEAIFQRDGRRVLEAIRRVDDLGYSFRQFCRELVELLRLAILVQLLDRPEDLGDIAADDLAELRALGAAADQEELHRTLTLLLKTEAELAGSSFPRLIMEMALVRLACLPPAQEVTALVQKLEKLELRLAEGTTSRDAAPPSAPSPSPEKPPPKVVAPAPQAIKGWPGLVQHVKAGRLSLGSILEQDGRLLKLELPILEIGFSGRTFDMVNDPDYRQSLQDFAEAYFAQSVQLQLRKLNGKEPNAPPSLQQEREAQATDRMKRLKDDALNHPLVKSAQKIFGGRIEEIKPIDKGFV